MTADDTPWWESALCAQVDPNLWHGEEGGHTSWVAFAKRLCGQCDHRQPCLDEALVVESQVAQARIYGVRGGLGPEQRRRLIQQMKGAAA